MNLRRNTVRCETIKVPIDMLNHSGIITSSNLTQFYDNSHSLGTGELKRRIQRETNKASKVKNHIACKQISSIQRHQNTRSSQHGRRTTLRRIPDAVRATKIEYLKRNEARKNMLKGTQSSFEKLIMSNTKFSIRKYWSIAMPQINREREAPPCKPPCLQQQQQMMTT